MKTVAKAHKRNKLSGVDGLPIELFLATETGAIKILTKICQQIWKTKNGPQTRYV